MFKSLIISLLIILTILIWYVYNFMSNWNSFYECKIWNYDYIFDVQYIWLDWYAFIGRRNISAWLLSKNPKYFLVENGKEVASFDLLYWLKYAPNWKKWVAMGGNYWKKDISSTNSSWTIITYIIPRDPDESPFLIKDWTITDIEFSMNDLKEKWFLEERDIYWFRYYNLDTDKIFVFSPDSKRFAYVYFDTWDSYVNLDWNDLTENITNKRKIKEYNIFNNEPVDKFTTSWFFYTINDLKFSSDSKQLFYIWDEIEQEYYIKNGKEIQEKQYPKTEIKYTSTWDILEKKWLKEITSNIHGIVEISSNNYIYWTWTSAIAGITNKFWWALIRETWLPKVCTSKISILQWILTVSWNNKNSLIMLYCILFFIVFKLNRNNDSKETWNTWNYWLQNNSETIKATTKYQPTQNGIKYIQSKTQEELEQERKEKERITLQNQRNKLIPENYIKKFLQHAERNYEKVDKYWNKNKNSLEKEIAGYLVMIAEQGWDKFQINSTEAYARGKSYPALNDDYKWLVSYLKSEFNKYHAERKQKIASGMNNISEMTWIEFEKYLASIFRSAWYSIDMTPESWDQWADIIAEKNARRIVIQAKRYTGSVGNGAIQEVIWAIRYYDGTEWWVITNSIFTNSARELARVNHIILIDGESLEDIRNLI